MALGFCPKCDQLVGITPSGVPQNPRRGTSTWWLVDVHKHPTDQVICPGSGKKV